MTFFAKCMECLEVVEVNIPANYDGPAICPLCRAIDCFEETCPVHESKYCECDCA